MDDQSNRTGRLKRPTERFQSYLEQAASSSRQKKAKTTTTNKSFSPPNDDNANDDRRIHHNHDEHSALNHKENTKTESSSISRPRSTRQRMYACSHCGYSCAISSAQHFIRSHHMKEEIKTCFQNGLFHCPNVDCKKVFLTDNDLERHCSMKGSKDPCLQYYNEMKSMASINKNYRSSQVNFAVHMMTKEETKHGNISICPPQMRLFHFGTLVNDSTEDSDSLKVLPSATSDAGYTSRSHYHNVLLSNGAYSTTIDNQGQSKFSKIHQASRPEEGTVGERHDDYAIEFAYFENDMNPHSTATEEPDVLESLVVVHTETSTSNDAVLSEMQESLENASRSSCFTREDKACIQLEDIIRKAGGPLYLYDRVMAWACQHKDVLPSQVPYINRKALYNNLSTKIYGNLAETMKPKEVKTILPSGRHCGVTIFNIYAQIMKLLSNETINKWENYFFSPTEDNPFHLNTFSDWDTGFFDDIETSIWYKRTQTSVLTDEGTEILIPICLFIDSTVLSLSGTLSLEPVMFSLMIHNRETRKNPLAWLPLGYINDPTSIPGTKYSNTVEKYTDYHAMLAIVLSDLTDLVNRNDGLIWDFQNVPRTDHRVRKKLLFRVAFIIGDTKGHDVLCCRMGSHNHTPGLCRDCDMLTVNADDPFMPCHFWKQSDLEKMTEEQLRSYSFLRVMNFPFNRMGFGASPYGINCATAIDVIHSILLGLMEYLNNTFIDQLTKKQLDKLSDTISFLATFCSRAIPGFPKNHHFKKGLLHIKGIMTATKKLARCFLVFLALKTTSFRSYLTNCSGKLPSVVKRTMRNQKMKQQHADENRSSDEEGGVSNSNDEKSSSYNGETSYNSSDDSTYDPHKETESREPIIFTNEVIDNWIELFENVLLFYGWLTSDKLPCAMFKYGSLSIAKYCTQMFMTQYKDVAYRYEGMGLKLTKFHQLRHWYFYITMYGVPTNFDSSFCESHHIHHTKRTGKRTQKRQDDLAKQTALRVHEASILESAVQRTHLNRSTALPQRRLTHRHKYLRGSKFSIDFDYSAPDIECLANNQQCRYHQQSIEELFGRLPNSKFKWLQKRNHGKRCFPQMIHESIVRKLAWFNNGNATRRINSIIGYTELRIPCSSEKKTQRDIIRAHPDYKKNGLWLDWIDVIWETGDNEDDITMLPAQVMMILDFDSAEYEFIPGQFLLC